MNGSGQPTRQIFLLGLEEAEWNLLGPLVTQGKLRFLGDLVASEVGGPLTTPPPVDRLPQWTTLATGKRAHQHGVFCSSLVRREGRGVTPVVWSTSRAVHVAEILHAQQMHVHLLGWPGAHPVPPLDGIVVDQQFAMAPSTATRQAGRPWCHPPVAAAELFTRRVAASEIDEVTLAGFIPSRLRDGLADQPLVAACRQAIAETATLFRVAKFALGITPWNATFCVLPLLSRVSSLAGKVRQTTGSEALADALLLGAYEYLDLLIGQLLQQAGASVDVLLVGMGRQAPFACFRSVQAPDAWPRNASLLDVAPTILSVLGLATGEDMPGQSWSVDSPGANPPEPIASWDAVVSRIATPAEALSTWPPASVKPGPAEDDPSVRHLLDLGYVDPLETAAQQEATRLGEVAEFHRALSLADGGRSDEALKILTRLADAAPSWIGVGNALSRLYLGLDRIDAATAQLDRLVERGAESAELYVLRAQIAVRRRDLPAADQALYVAGRIDPGIRCLALLRGTICLRRGDYREAAAAFLQAARIEGSTAPLEDGLTVCCLANGELEEAADHALRAVACDPNYAPAHYRLGRVLLQMGRVREAQVAFTRASEADPTMGRPITGWQDSLTIQPNRGVFEGKG